MEDLQALVILRSLANGVDPESGQLLDSGSAFQRPQTVSALGVAVRALERAEKQERRRSLAPSKANVPWAADEDQQLLKAFDSGMSPRQLAATHQRSPKAVKARLAKLGRYGRVP